MQARTSPALAKLQKLLSASSLAIAWRQGKWLILGQSEREHRELPPSLYQALSEMLAKGQVVAGEDGCLRWVNATHHALLRSDESPFSRLINMRESNGSSYFDRGQIRAGEKLRVHYERAHLAARVTANYTPSIGGGDQHWKSSDNAISRLTDSTLEARQEVHLALEAVGPELSSILLKICCMDCGIEEAERVLAIPRRAGKAILALGLTRLARHYGFKSRQRHSGPEKIGHWAIDDYRPAIAPRANSAPLA